MDDTAIADVASEEINQLAITCTSFALTFKFVNVTKCLVSYRSDLLRAVETTNKIHISPSRGSPCVEVFVTGIKIESTDQSPF